MSRFRMSVAVVLLCGVAVAGCGSADSAGPSAPPPVGADAGASSIRVLAAASLTESFTELGAEFEAANPGVDVSLNFAGSSALARQINDGAPADVFASASTSTMDNVVAAGRAGEPVVFATNAMAIGVSPDNPAQVMGVQDLAKPSVTTALCQPQVPCGATAARVFANAGLTVTPVTLEPDVRAVLSKVTLGEVDAGVVYVTDIKAAGAKVRGVDIPAAMNASTSYPIATLTSSSEPATAAAFVDFVLSPAGQAVLTDAGFSRP